MAGSLKTTPLLLMIFFYSFYSLPAQTHKEIRMTEDSLKSMLQKIAVASNDSQRLVFNELFGLRFEEFLKNPRTFNYPFDSLKAIGKLAAPDNRFRIFTWNFRLENGRYKFFGFIQQPGTSKNSVIVLHDRSDSIPDAETRLLSPKNWYGARYYGIIPLATENADTLYTLLGWNGNNSLVTQKLIEVLSFGKSGEVVFGAAIFKNYHQNEDVRIIFRYSAQSSMILRPQEQEITTSKKWDSRKNKFTTESRKGLIIVCDRLIPLDPQLEELYQHYVPASDIYDGFLPDHGKWLFIKGIDFLNSK